MDRKTGLEPKGRIAKKKAASNWAGCLFWIGLFVFFGIIIAVISKYFPQIEPSEFQVKMLFVIYYSFCIGLYVFYDGLRKYREFRILTVTTKSPIHGLAMGFVEISGLAKPIADSPSVLAKFWEHPPCSSPISGTPCLWYRVNIEEANLDAKGGRVWNIYHLEFYGWQFYLQDETGKVLVDGSGAHEDLPITCQCEIEILPTGSPKVRAGSPNEPTLAAYVSKGWQRGLVELHPQPGQIFRLTERCLLPEHRYSVAGTCVENPAPRDELDRNMIVKGETEESFEISWQGAKGMRSNVLAKAEHAIYGGAAISLASVAFLLITLHWNDIAEFVFAATIGFGVSALMLAQGVKGLREFRGLKAQLSGGEPEAKLKTDLRDRKAWGIFFLSIGSACLCGCLLLAFAEVVRLSSARAARSVPAPVSTNVAAAVDESLPAHSTEAPPAVSVSVPATTNQVVPMAPSATAPWTSVPLPPPRPLRTEKADALPRTTIGFSGVWLSDGSMTNTRPICQPLPEYPQTARMARIQGSVVLNVTIAKDGTVQKVKVLSGHPLLVQAAVDGVQRWRCVPTLQGGQPVDVSAQVYVGFSLP